ncbi:hypothetical protein A3A66_04360 [Microgenomates group bacterium RIFCSPLOWO2_01_FULL_46_13]|nr:MAG: hypothetical protein A2783_04310 [Microgenomates group bacterium RIFCSPHIGHO2_01_FULL_45_11]OGV94207.1 MAG: hypothetical protein A3A66_04360 [Microgenomates group bacterium RIFCSPLOWO2_01_FULL_46_13]
MSFESLHNFPYDPDLFTDERLRDLLTGREDSYGSNYLLLAAQKLQRGDTHQFARNLTAAVMELGMLLTPPAPTDELVREARWPIPEKVIAHRRTVERSFYETIDRVSSDVAMLLRSLAQAGGYQPQEGLTPEEELRDIENFATTLLQGK